VRELVIGTSDGQTVLFALAAGLSGAVDNTIDVAGGRITGFSGLGDTRQTYDERVELPPGTYWVR
jgi:hypothetical protein